MRISIITLNCFYNITGNNSSRVMSILFEISKLKPDIICLQEIASHKQTRISKKALKTLGYNVFSTPGIIFNRGGLVFASKFPIEKYKYTKFKNQGKFFSFQITDRILSKGFQRIELIINSKKISVYNTHIISRYNESSEKEEKIQEQQLDELAEEISGDNNDYKMCLGDFNVKSSGNCYLKFIKNTNLVDSLGENLVTFSSKNSHVNERFGMDFDSRIDYILHSSNIKNVGTEIIFKDPLNIDNKIEQVSDHFGIYSHLEI